MHRRLLATAVLLVLFLVAGEVDSQQFILPETPDDYVQDARDAISREEYQYAVERLTEGIARFPDAVDIRTELAELYYDKELYDLALQHYQAAERLSPQSYSVLYDTALTLGRLNRESEAIEYLQRIEEIYPGSPELSSDLGWLFFKTRQLDAGEEVLLDAIQKYGEDRSVSMTLGTIYAAMYRYGDSRLHYHTAIDNAVDNGLSYFASVAYYNLSLLEKSFYEFEKAMEHTNRSLLHAKRATGHLARGELYEMQMDLASAHREYQRAYTLDEETPLPQINLAALYQRSGHLDRALTHIEAVYNQEDLSWMFNFGIDEVRHAKDLHEILAETHLGLSKETWRTPATGLLPRVKRLASFVRHRVLAWYHRHSYVQLADKTASTYLERSNYLDAYWTYYLAAGDNPRVAGKYLALARRLETEVIPKSQAYYDLEAALLRRDTEEIRNALGSLDPLWEAAQVESGLIGILEGSAPGDHLYNHHAARLHRINPGAFRQYGVRLPAEIRVHGLSPGAHRAVRRHLRRCGIVDGGNDVAITIEVYGVGDSITARAAGEAVAVQTFVAESDDRASLAALAADIADGVLRYPLQFAEPVDASPEG